MCERQQRHETAECFPEIGDQGDVFDNQCVGRREEFARCALRHKDDYCDYYLWQNRGSVRQHGYVVSDTLPQGNSFVECLDERGIRDQ